jgi:diguanylate cyclase (GGDEF)-like protein
MIKALLWWLVLVCPIALAVPPSPDAAPVATLSAPSQVWNIGLGVQHLPGEAAEDFKQALAAPADQWTVSQKNALALGSLQAGAWLRFDILNQSAEETRWLLKFAWPLLDHVELRLYHRETGHWGRHLEGGDALPLSVRPIPDRMLLFPLDLPAGEVTSVYLRVHAAEQLILPMQVLSETQHQIEEANHLAVIYLFFGGMLVILLYNAFLFLFTGDRSYVFYTLYLTSIIGYELCLTGLGQLYLWPDAPRFSVKAYGIFAAASFLMGTLFARVFLQLRAFGSWPYQLNNLIIAYWAVMLFAVVFLPAMLPYLLPNVLPSIGTLVSLVVTAYLWYRGSISAKLFTVAWASLIIFTLIHLLALNGALPLNTFTLGSQMLGIYIEFILLSIALAERINRARTDRIKAQNNALLSSQQLAREREEKLRAQQRTLEIQREANDKLEQRVRERTQALESAKIELERAIEELARLSVTDPLTRLFNRRYFDSTIAEEVSRSKRTGIPLSLLMVDIDHFKNINDTYGHPFGDECLRQVAQVLQQYTQRAGDVAARYGGEEFIIALPATPIEQAALIAERIRCSIEAIVLEYQGETVRLTASLGVASLVPGRDEGSDTLIACADAALYRAKRNGRNQIVTHA